MEISLPTSAVPAWEAYSAMGESKQRHFEYLRYLEQKYERYGRPGPRERALLADLLRVHDARVMAFRTAVQALKKADPQAYGALVGRLSADTAAVHGVGCEGTGRITGGH
jgi:hypothetical protein